MFKKFLGRKNARSVPETSSGDLSRAPTMSSSSAFLHGRLNVRVVEARNVEGRTPNLLGRLERVVTSSVDGVDPYCTVKLGYDKLLQTCVVQNSPSPSWDAFAVLDCCLIAESLEFRVKAAKRGGPFSMISKVKHLSMLSIPATEIRERKMFSGWFPLGPYRRDFEPDDPDDDTSSDEDSPDPISEEEAITTYGEILVEVAYTPISEMRDLSDLSVVNTYFPLRRGVKVTMYQDADSPPGLLPPIPFNPEFTHSRCWLELASAIMSSNEFIYITGWAVWPQLVMVRTDHPGDMWNGLTLGEMLIQKAEEGVRVCVMVWDELASGRFFKGIMGTHDEEVVSYFRKSKVHAIKVGRQNARDGPLADLNDSVLFTHHQKTVIVSRTDPDVDGRHRVEAWVGGLDLTDGRYDNQNHSLFRTLDGLHAPPDFWQACALTVGGTSGPREPWHDIHAHMTGTAAWDILTNFEGRWTRQAPDGKKGLLHRHSEETFVQPHEEDSIRDGSWNVQVLRSINASSTQLNSERDGLIVRRNAPTDQSIHHAYVHFIRNAKHFIYIENQYFLGSSHMWDSGQRGGFASNLIPIEIAEKICAKIRAGERFVVYVAIPLYPEGAPDSGPVQEILSHQRKTVSLITTRIARTIEETGSETKVSDWFNMFCLVNRESEEDGKGDGGSNPLEQQLSESRRFMIYIHSKFAIFDDTVAIIGSANINSRSLDGSRDTEIAIAAWQPEHVATGSTGYGLGGEDDTEENLIPSLPKGDVAAFRASVWSEHLGQYLSEFEDPSSEECVSKICEMATANWEHFAAEDMDPVQDMPFGHLAAYPYEVNENGDVSSKQESMPDFPAALVKGRATPGIPNMLTG